MLQLLVACRDSGGARPEFGGDVFEALEGSAGQDGSFEELEVGWGHLRVGEGEADFDAVRLCAPGQLHPRSTAPESMTKRRWMVRRSVSLASWTACRCVEITPSIRPERNRNPLASAETPPISHVDTHRGLRPAAFTLSSPWKISPRTRTQPRAYLRAPLGALTGPRTADITELRCNSAKKAPTLTSASFPARRPYPPWKI